VLFAGALVLSSGNAAGGNCVINDSDGYSASLGKPGDPVLSAYSGVSTYDATSLEFDIIAKVDGELTFSYIFGSEEYNEYVGSFNDVFGFFINGQNVAMIGNSAVTIDNVNLNSNSNLFVNNDQSDFGSITPHATQFDGFTKVLSTKPYQVISGQTYHIKLAIADAADSVLDSIVFIKANSLAVCPAGLINCNGNCVSCCPASDFAQHVCLIDHNCCESDTGAHRQQPVQLQCSPVEVSQTSAVKPPAAEAALLPKVASKGRAF
jgi:hypothetical protein